MWWPDELQQGRDYYLDNGLMIFTEDFLRRRGFCCECGCRHCPYGFRGTAPPWKPAPDKPLRPSDETLAN